MSDKTKTHTVYRLGDGTRVPSVTTVLGVINKPALLKWAWECGMRGEDYRKVRDEAADIGTLAHYLIMCHLRGIEPDTAAYSPEQVKAAEVCLMKYWDWEKEHNIKPVLVEVPLTSEAYSYGGTVDCLARSDDDLLLIDYKTGKHIYDEMFLQLAAYAELLRGEGYYIKNARILRIGRDEREGFEERLVAKLEPYWQAFEHCLHLYNALKTIRGTNMPSTINGTVERVEDADYQGQPYKKVTLVGGATYNVKRGQGGSLQQKWGLLVPGAHLDLQMGEYQGKPYVKDIFAAAGAIPAGAAVPAPAVPPVRVANGERASIENQVAIKCITEMWCAGKLDDPETKAFNEAAKEKVRQWVMTH